MRPSMVRRRWVLVLAFTAVVMLVTANVLLWPVLSKGRSDDGQSGPEARPTAPTSTQPARTGTTGDLPGNATELAAEVNRLRAMPPVTGASALPRITGDVTTQPDLYAAEFVRRLLTQDYRTPRAALLAWVQAESAQTSEPLVLGLVPADLRDRLAVFSVTDATGDTAPIPTASQWSSLAAQGGYTTVRIDRVLEPLAWSNAVAAGRISDDGVTGRLVAATITRHTTSAGGPATQRFSVSLAVNLEGPPTRDRWGFVAAVTYTAIPLESS